MTLVSRFYVLYRILSFSVLFPSVFISFFYVLYRVSSLSIQIVGSGLILPIQTGILWFMYFVSSKIKSFMYQIWFKSYDSLVQIVWFSKHEQNSEILELKFNNTLDAQSKRTSIMTNICFHAQLSSFSFSIGTMRSFPPSHQCWSFITSNKVKIDWYSLQPHEMHKLIKHQTLDTGKHGQRY